MTPQEIARQRAEVMIAFADGAEIERCARQQWPERWIKVLGDVDWNWVYYDYRVKTQPKTVTIETWCNPVSGYVQSYVAGSRGKVISEDWELIKTETIGEGMKVPVIDANGFRRGQMVEIQGTVYKVVGVSRKHNEINIKRLKK